jgi:hypothetical protein
MIIRFTFFGSEIFCLTIGDYVLEEVEDEDTNVIGGGSTHDFERDIDPLDPNDHFGEWEFGFRGPKRVRKGDQRASD